MCGYIAINTDAENKRAYNIIAMYLQLRVYELFLRKLFRRLVVRN